MEAPRTAIIGTNDEALSCRVDLHACGLLVDPAVELFQRQPGGALPPSTGSAPLIRRGTFLRSVALDRAILRAVGGAAGGAQLLVLGAGFDTRPFREPFQRAIAAAGLAAYVEVDLPAVIEAKRRIVKEGRLLERAAVPLVMVACDLNGGYEGLVECLLASGAIDPRLALVVVAECALMYVERGAARSIVAGLASDGRWRASPAGQRPSLVLFDVLLLEDEPFSRQMVANFWHGRAIDLTTASPAPPVRAPGDQARVLEEHFGWSVAAFHLLADLAETDLVGEGERRALARLAALDEYEEWRLVGGHYYLAVLT